MENTAQPNLFLVVQNDSYQCTTNIIKFQVIVLLENLFGLYLLHVSCDEAHLSSIQCFKYLLRLLCLNC